MKINDFIRPGHRLLTYLEHPDKWAHHGPVLFRKIQDFFAASRKRRVSLIENTDLLPRAGYSSRLFLPPMLFSSWRCSLSIINFIMQSYVSYKETEKAKSALGDLPHENISNNTYNWTI
jgi:hypothetical protein